MREQLLIVDDSVALHQLIRSHLAEDHIQVHSAHDGAAGLVLANKLRPNVILLDVDMPDMDGFEVLRRLKENKDTSTIPVVFITADLATGDKVRGLDLGAVDYITKPFNFSELNARIRAALRFKHQFDQRAMIDGLTGLWNRSYLDDHLATQINIWQRTGKPLSCIVADVDHLSQLNAKHGWQIGNEALRLVGNVLLSQCRSEDAICYCGEGRFSILLSGMDRRAAARLADRLCHEVRHQCTHIQAREVNLTCSFGVADCSVTEECRLLQRAESAVERAKINGRSTVSVARPLRTEIAVAA